MEAWNGNAEVWIQPQHLLQGMAGFHYPMLGLLARVPHSFGTMKSNIHGLKSVRMFDGSLPPLASRK